MEKTIKTKEVDCGNGITIVMFYYNGDGDPVAALDKAIYERTKDEVYDEFIDMNMDNPWSRIVVIGQESKNLGLYEK